MPFSSLRSPEFPGPLRQELYEPGNVEVLIEKEKKQQLSQGLMTYKDNVMKKSVCQ